MDGQCDSAAEEKGIEKFESNELEEGEISEEEEATVSPKKGLITVSLKQEKSAEPPKENDIEEFLRKKREDLQQKVKNQLELAGYRANVSEGTEKDPDMVLPDSFEKKDSSSAFKARKSAKAEPFERHGSRKGHRYHDLDPEPLNASDPHETMINSWLSHKKPKKQESTDFGERGSPESSGYDPNDEFYFGARASPIVEPTTSTSATSSTGDKDYRSSSREDKDYRWSQSSTQKDYAIEEERTSPEASRSVTSNEYGDRDYRHSERSFRSLRFSTRDKEKKDEKEKERGARRKRYSGGSEEDYEDEDGRKSRDDTRRKRINRRSVSPVRRKGSRWGDRPPSICKFFRDGYCRDGEGCSYSHNAADSLRKPELCKYYQQGYCRRPVICPFLHGEYPCKAFHKNECSKGDECPYSHTALNDFTKPIFDQMIRDEELTSKIKIPQVPTKRKVLLGLPPPMPPPSSGPKMKMMGPRHGPGGPMPRFDGPMPPPQPPFMDNNSNFPRGGPGNLPMMPGFPPPPPNFIPPPNTSRVPNVPPRPPLSSDFEQKQNESGSPHPIKQEEPEQEQEEQQIKTEPSGSSYNINEMLRKIRATVQAEEEPAEESPASPPPQTPTKSQPSVPQNIPFHGIPKYRLILVDVAPTPVDPALLTKSLTDNKLRNDPRIKKLLDSQFNAVSNMITTSQKSAESKLAKERTDPRSSARDPRLAKQGGPTTATGASTSVMDSPKPMDTSPPPPATSAADSQMQEMIKMQLQMAAAMQLPPGMMGPPMGNMPPQGLPAPGMGMGGPMLAGPGPPGPPMFGNQGPVGGGGPMLGPGPGPSMMNQGPPSGAGMNSGGWMPQFGGGGSGVPPPPMGMDGNGFGGPPLGIPPPGVINGPISLATPITSIADTMTVWSSDGFRQTKDPRSRPSRWNRSPPPYQASPTNYSENVPPSQENFEGDASPLLDSKPVVSLREKRKDLQYESPLAAGQSRIPGGSETSRYNEMPNVKVKRKTSPSILD